jgi:hypothetical protein
MLKLHITQDDFDRWMLSLENEDGQLGLLAYEIATWEKAVEHAKDWMKERGVRAMILIDPPRSRQAARAAGPPPDDYAKPAPRKAGA